MTMSALYWTNTLNLIFIVLAHWNNCPRVNMSLQSDIFSWFRANRSMPFLLEAACLAENQQIPILKSLVWPDRSSNQRFTGLELTMQTITPSKQRYHHFIHFVCNHELDCCYENFNFLTDVKHVSMVYFEISEDLRYPEKSSWNLLTTNWTITQNYQGRQLIRVPND